MADEGQELEALRAGVRRWAADLPITELLPVFVPSSLFALRNWPGPYDLLALPGLGLTWSVFLPEQTMRYVDSAVQAQWEAQGIPWRERALENLRQRSAAQPWTHEFRRDAGALFAVAMMHPDGAGPSRLLLGELLHQSFPEGHLVALPETTCAFAVSVAATASEREKIDGLVERCFVGGTRPLVPGVHQASLLLRGNGAR